MKGSKGTLSLNFVENFGTVFLYDVYMEDEKVAVVVYDASDGDIGVSNFTDCEITENTVRTLVESSTRVLVEHDAAPGVTVKNGEYFWRK